MYTLKEKVSNQLSRLFADSPSSSAPSSLHEKFQARHFSKGGKIFSSFFPFVSPWLSSLESEPNKQQDDLRSTQSLPAGWGCNQFKEREEYTVKYPTFDTVFEEEIRKCSEDSNKYGLVGKNKQIVSTDETNEDGPPIKIIDSSMRNEAHSQQTSGEVLSDVADESAFISQELYVFLKFSLPNIVKGCKWTLLYSTLKHGISLRTLIRNSSALSGPCLLIVGDRQGSVFGGLLECPLIPTAKRKYQGTNQSFVFTTIYGEPRLFRPTGANRYYYMCMNDLLAFGGGGNFALHLDGDLLTGSSGPCETFGNLCLALKDEFELKNVEVIFDFCFCYFSGTSAKKGWWIIL
ncbi:hypothetical protein K2173_021518 [Erythroxylum novogranatense]|uniref:TLDc domain-containing protein n=1 Tax=Erythroxylum novogranatense TaxID=1862640 RepID=A0AAV8TQ38_9ROSI|nr:hypothetical protein K2173_021518 [Erythroxylum novogranatense]